MMKLGYTAEKNTLILISLLKAHGIKKIIASPGTTNVSFVLSVQNDPFFQVFSAFDERAAAFMACGMSEETGEAVVLSCTGATASRNYIPGLTEAYYKKLPILAVTSTQHIGKAGSYSAQFIDRSQQFSDMVKHSAQIDVIYTKESEELTVNAINKAILELYNDQPGPVHINLATQFSNDFSVEELPYYRKISKIKKNDVFPELSGKKIGVFVGAHETFDSKTTDAIDAFCSKFNAIVLCDQTSNFRGKYRVLASLINSQIFFSESTIQFDTIIYIGYVSGAYLNIRPKEVWRVNPDGEFRDPFNKLTYIFQMTELDFFSYYDNNNDNYSDLLQQCIEERNYIESKIPELPFSNIWIAQHTAKLIPQNSVIHFGILNSLRSWNYFETPDTVSCFCNTGGFGIDGCVSSIIGAALVNKNKQYYCVLGDLAFFYDINVLFEKIPSNVHIMIINNGVGVEFKNYSHRCSAFGHNADPFIAAKGHNGFKSSNLLKNVADSIDMRYLSASSKEEYLANVDQWLTLSDKAVIFEVFIEEQDDIASLKTINMLGINFKKRILNKVRRIFGR